MGPLALDPQEPGLVRTWVDRLSNWQFVAVAAGVLMLAAVLIHCVVSLAFDGTHISVFTDDELGWAVTTTIVLAWARWK